jgi:hypothetical protein
MLNELRVGELLAALGERTPTPASGVFPRMRSAAFSATIITGA